MTMSHFTRCLLETQKILILLNSLHDSASSLLALFLLKLMKKIISNIDLTLCPVLKNQGLLQLKTQIFMRTPSNVFYSMLLSWKIYYYLRMKMRKNLYHITHNLWRKTTTLPSPSLSNHKRKDSVIALSNPSASKLALHNSSRISLTKNWLWWKLIKFTRSSY